MNNTRILAQIRAMSDSEVMEMVPPRIIRDIKRDDPRPLFKAFVVVQEGTAEPTAVGIGKTIQRWFSSAIKALFMKLDIGTKVFNGHEETNSHEGRTAVGEVIGKAIRTVNGFLSTVAVTYIYPAFKDFPFDVASVEAMIDMPADEKKFDVEEADVIDVTGIAVGDSRVDKPAFPGATLQAALQAFAEKDYRQGGETKMTQDQIKQAILEGKFKPSDVFGPTELTSDPYVKEHVGEKIDNAKGYQFRKMQEYETKISTLEAEKKTFQDELASTKSSILKTRAADTFNTVLNERPKLKENARLADFARKQFEKSFVPSDEAKLKPDMDTFMDSIVSEYGPLFGEKASGNTTPHDGKLPDGDKGKPEPAEGEEALPPVIDPKKNPYIPTD